MQQGNNILLIELDEANTALGHEAAFLSLAEDSEEALRRYHAIAEVMLAQLVGLRDCHVRFVVAPADGVDAVRFWLLPMLRGEVQPLTGSSQVYQFFPEQHAPSLTIDFAVDEGDLSPYKSVARLNPFCLDCGARLLNMALLQCTAEQNIVGDGYLWVSSDALLDNGKDTLPFPKMPIVKSDACWETILKTAIGGKLDLAYKKHL